MNVNICIENVGNTISTRIAEYSFEKCLLKRQNGTSLIMMRIYVCDLYISSFYLMHGGEMLEPAKKIHDAIKNMDFNKFYKSEFHGDFDSPRNNDIAVVNNDGLQLLFTFNEDNFEEFKEILSFVEWFCKMNKVVKG